jgi:hypothetical protein
MAMKGRSSSSRPEVSLRLRRQGQDDQVVQLALGQVDDRSLLADDVLSTSSCEMTPCLSNLEQRYGNEAPSP